MLKATKRRYQGRLSQILSSLVEWVRQLSHTFSSIASKYTITNFIHNEGIGGLGKLNVTFEKVKIWQGSGLGVISQSDPSYLQKLESLRASFAPGHIESNLYQRTSVQSSWIENRLRISS
jgi:hypothetical protein